MGRGRGRPAVWPPRVCQRRGYDYVRLPLGAGRYREVRLGLAGSEDSRREYARLLAELAAGASPLRPAAGLSVVEAAVAYQEQGGTPEQRTDSRRRRALAAVRLLYGHTPLADFGPLALRAVRVRLASEGLSHGYVNSLVGCIRQWLKWCVRQELCSPLQLAAVREETAAPQPRRRRRPVDPADVETTLACLPWPVADMVRLLRLTGCRPIEVCRLRPCDVERDWMAVEGVPLWLYSPGRHKREHAGGQRDIPLGPQAQAILLPYLQRDSEAPCFSPRESVAWAGVQRRGPGSEGGDSRRLARTGRRVGTAYTTATLDQVLRRAVERAGVRPWTLYDLRRRAATEAYAAGSVEDAAAKLGHSSPSITHVYIAKLLRAAALAAREG